MIFTLYIFFKDKIKETILPDTDTDRFSVDISAHTGKKGCILELKNTDGIWSVSQNEHITVNSKESAVLEDGKTVTISIKRTSVSAVLLISKTEPENAPFKSYFLSDTVVIGVNKESDILINHELVSHIHAIISLTDSGFCIEDKSRNGVYINGKKIKEKTRLRMFDTVCIFGTKIIFLGEIVAVSVNVRTEVTLSEAENIKNETNSVKFNMITKNESLTVCEQSIEPLCIKGYAPVQISDKNTDIADTLKPAIPSAAVLSASAAIIGSLSLPVLAGTFAGTAALISASMYGLRKIQTGKESKKINEKNREDSEKYYSECIRLMKDKVKEYESFMSSKYISVVDAVVSEKTMNTGKISKDSPDFLRVRVGTGRSDLRFLLKLNNSDDQKLCELAEQYLVSDSVPQILDLSDEKKYIFSGEKEEICNLAAGIAVLCSLLFSTGDVRMMSFITPDMAEYFRFIRWLPHICSDDNSERYAAEDEKSYRKLLFKLTGILQKRYEKRRNGYGERFFPHYIIFCSSEDIFINEPIRRFTEITEDIGAVFIFLNVSDNQCVSISGNSKTVLSLVTTNGLSVTEADMLARRLAAMHEADNYAGIIPERLTFFEMLGINKAEDVDILKKYNENKSSEGIRACIGTSADSRFILDIHESMHGPHGLAAGTTGSGKSEMLQTLVLSLALEYSPSEISFVLIDYKGGGMSQVFENLPHTAGIVTNISDGGNPVGRALVSLKSEIRRRQKIFRDYGINHTDAYMELYREGAAAEPMPHIIIICDEFAELKRAHPEFISQLVSTSRVGRSLGLHLILATQRPAGVVDNEIWSNSHFRICLKVQDKSDSNEMLRRYEAADITVTGRAFVQVGNDEIFEEIQTGYSGAEYNSSSDSKVYMINTDASPAVIQPADRVGSRKHSQLDILIGYINEICKKHNIAPSPKLWVNPLPSEVFLSELPCTEQDESGLICTFGIADDPEEQKVYAAVYDLYTSGNILAAGMSGSGKTTLVTTMIYSLADRYSPDKVNFSVLDFSGGLFSPYEKLPHCREILSLPAEKETASFFDRILSETERRRNIFISKNAADFTEYIKTADDVAVMVIFLDGYYFFRETYPVLEEKFTALSGMCSKYGIYLVTTVKQISDMRMRTRQNFRTVITFELSDSTEYCDFLGIRPENTDISVQGRGLIRKDRRILEFQTALCCHGTGNEKIRELSEKIAKIADRYSDIKTSFTSADKTIYCSKVKNMTSEVFAEIIENRTENSRVLVWSHDVSGEKEIKGAEYFYAADGMFSLLLALKKIFEVRNGQRKTEGTYHGEDITVVFRDLDDVCRCIYDEEYREDMSAITETFFEKGGGLGVNFIAGFSDNSLYCNKKAFTIFSSYDTGEEHVKSICI